jgi:multicomponent Na+:H+ antiporter subunit C
MSVLSSTLLSHGPYVLIIALFAAGLFIIFSTANLIRKLIGVAIMQSAAGLFYIAIGKVSGGTAAIIVADAATRDRLAAPLDPTYVERFGVDGVIYSNPLPHVLILTAIVVSLATLAVGLALAVRTREAYGTIEADEIAAASHAQDAEEAARASRGRTPA